jgi:hypothetical protein
MPTDLEEKVEFARNDFTKVTGAPFVHFHCPILGVDEETRLCVAHIVNKHVATSTRKCVVQRHDVDDFYGRAFEIHFQTWLRIRGKSIEDVLFDSDLRNRIAYQGVH